MIFSERLEGKTIRTGDIIATVDGGGSIYGALFHLIGEIVPGKPDHMALYLGPDGICVEAAPKGVNLFRFFRGRWDAERMQRQRGVVDKLYGLGDAVGGRLDDPGKSDAVREAVRAFVLDQVGKPYNMNFLEPEQDLAFYCSQLVFAAYKKVGIDLHSACTPALHPLLPAKVITPEEIWRGLRAIGKD